jgi:two-component system sensor histidine kinase CssS
MIEAEIEDGRLNIRISDDGSGIHPPDLPHIFERFYMGENGHAGIGLAITKEIIEHHQGIVTAANREYGAVFSISLNILNKK